MLKVAIIGRPNVGKSSLFNQLTGRRVSIVSPVQGVTRDRIQAVIRLENMVVQITDTGGLFGGPDDMCQGIHHHALQAVEESDFVLFLVDGKAGLHVYDHEVRKLLARTDKEALLVINKIDNQELEKSAVEFSVLPYDHINFSVLHNRGIGTLKDILRERAGTKGAVKEDAVYPKISILGRPNVGKSSLVNAVLSEERCLIDDKPGTTRDSNEVRVTYGGKTYILVDTAGIRRKKSIKEPVEHFSILRALHSLKFCDICLFMIDATQEVSAQDLRILQEAVDRHKGIVFAVNKTDLVPKGVLKELMSYYVARLTVIHFVPVVLLSAKTGSNIDQLFSIIDYVYSQYRMSVQTAVLNNVLEDLIKKSPPKHMKGKRLRLYYGTQTGTAPPRFRFFINHKGCLYEDYDRYICNGIRKAFGFEGISFKMEYKEKSGAKK